MIKPVYPTRDSTQFHYGIQMRDHFAIEIARGIFSTEAGVGMGAAAVGQMAYKAADAMLAARGDQS